MRSPCSYVFPLTAMLLLAACEEQPDAVVGLGADQLSPDLALVLPTAIPEEPVVRNVFDQVTAPAGPARSEHEGYGTYGEAGYGYQYDYDYSATSTAAGIWNEKTTAYFFPGYLGVTGSHDYIGNKSSIETTGTVALDGAVIGTNSSFREDSYPFIYPPWVTHSIFTQAVIYTDTECGLSGWGSSRHRVWWEAVLGGPSYEFSEVARTSNAARVYQPGCPPPPPQPQTGYVGGGDEGLCYLWITYDIYTGEIYDSQLLYCTDGG